MKKLNLFLIFLASLTLTHFSHAETTCPAGSWTCQAECPSGERYYQCAVDNQVGTEFSCSDGYGALITCYYNSSSTTTVSGTTAAPTTTSVSTGYCDSLQTAKGCYSGPSCCLCPSGTPSGGGGSTTTTGSTSDTSTSSTTSSSSSGSTSSSGTTSTTVGAPPVLSPASGSSGSSGTSTTGGNSSFSGTYNANQNCTIPDAVSVAGNGQCPGGHTKIKNYCAQMGAPNKFVCIPGHKDKMRDGVSARERLKK